MQCDVVLHLLAWIAGQTENQSLSSLTSLSISDSAKN